MTSPQRNDIELAYRQIQEEICSAIAIADAGGSFSIEPWLREEGGGGITRILQGGKVLEKAGVNFSAVEGTLDPMMQQSLKIEANNFFATGVSIVMHPINPHVPIIHMNIRYFETDRGDFWFGGGIDLTPHYVMPEQASWFHKQLQATCAIYDKDWYQQFKAWADEYFFIPHRNETRGVGGIFYDHLKPDASHSKETIFQFSCAIGRLFPVVYSHLMYINMGKPFTPAEKEWQLLRRGRYVEFNLVYDRGTKFGLYSNGRTESILMSLPMEARWYYDHHPNSESPEASTSAYLRKGVDWVGIE